MKKANTLVWYLYHHHFLRYLFVGGTTFIIDEALLIALHGKLGVQLTVSLFFSYLVAFVYNFSLNRWWAFSASENKTLAKHLAPYMLLFTFNLIFNIVFVNVVSHFINYAFAKALAVITQMAWTYFIYKNVIFVRTEQKSTSEDTTATTSIT